MGVLVSTLICLCEFKHIPYSCNYDKIPSSTFYITFQEWSVCLVCLNGVQNLT